MHLFLCLCPRGLPLLESLCPRPGLIFFSLVIYSIAEDLLVELIWFLVHITNLIWYVNGRNQVKNVRAKDEKEASLAELEVSKMQVEATEEAERKKNSLGQ